MFKLYKTDKSIPLFKGMECYFSSPFLGWFNQEGNFYYIIIQSIEQNGYYLAVHDKALFSMMDGGCDMGENWIRDRYQADEYGTFNKEELFEQLEKLFQSNIIEDIEAKLPLLETYLKKHIENQKAKNAKEKAKKVKEKVKK